MMRKTFLYSAVLAVFFSASSAAFAQESSYFGSLGRAWKRGLTNIVTSPLEIPVTVREYHSKEGRPVIRHSAGFVDGTFQMLERLGSGVFDLLVSPIPGQQEGIAVEPETLF